MGDSCPHKWEDVLSGNGKIVYGQHCPRCGDVRAPPVKKKQKRHNKRDQDELFQKEKP